MSFYGRSDPERYDTREEKAADDRDFAESNARWEAQHVNTKYVELPEWKEQPYPPLRSGTKGTNTADHPGRGVHRERFIPNEDVPAPNPAGGDPPGTTWTPRSEPDFEAITERRQERHRPDWA